MGRRLTLDTNILTAYERGTADRAMFRSDELSIAAITLAEYRVGIEMANTVETGRSVVSRDASARFGALPGVTCLTAA